jgi:EAL domain-containing protein (putative c-di-GMP-specific phosphodiesterase class I)
MSAPLPVGARVDRYTVLGVLGQGAFGVTYAAKDIEQAREVALKEFFPRSFARRDRADRVGPANDESEGTFRWGLQRFRDEARTLARFDHPNIVRVLRVFDENGTAYMAMERLRGVTLADAINSGAVTSERVLLGISHALLSGLEQIHSAGVMHRDVKPENILLRDGVEPVLLDFGSAREALQDGSHLTAVITRGYAPYEQYRQSSGEMRQGPWTDLYGLAASLYHVVTRAVPVDAMTRGVALAEGRADPLLPATVIAEGEWSPRFLEAIDAALAFNAAARPSSTAQWRTMLPTAPPDAVDAVKADTARPTRDVDAVRTGDGIARRDDAMRTITAPAEVGDRAARLEESVTRLDVLIVDDEEFVLDLTRRVLLHLGMTRVSTAGGGRDALAQIDARVRPPDVIICDLNMPDLDGVEFMRHLGARRAQCGVILLSGVESNLLKAAETLAQSHGLYLLGSLVKPANSDALRKLLATFGTTPVSHATIRRAEVISEQELVHGLARNAIEVLYQPKVRVADRRVVGVEALARWNHPLRGQLGPAAFVPLAEETGYMEALTDAVLRKALAAGADWMAAGLDLQVAVNLSADSLKELDLPGRVVALAESLGFPPERVMLEVTETRVMQDLVSATEILTRLRLRGVGLAVDDFGTGFSSLEQLRRAPFTELKIDRAFVHGARGDPALYAILESSAALAKRLGLTLVAEGVEDRDDWDVVCWAGCDLVQGYYVARPMPGHLIPAWVKQWSAGM